MDSGEQGSEGAREQVGAGFVDEGVHVNLLVDTEEWT
jgi:hypothetical protein